MKTIFRTLMTMAFAAMPFAASAQKTVDPVEYVTYSLPTTALILEVEAVQESFYCGPYARYAEKYLGIKVRQKDETKWQITEVGLNSVVEADLAKRYTLELKNETPDLTFLKLTSAGLVAFADGATAQVPTWRFPIEGAADFSDKGVSSNLKSEATTLYRGERKEAAYSRVSVQQNMVVEKTLEQKAAEAAQMIVRLRDQKVRIITGDTDATYSGEAMGAAVAELSRLEEEYMSLFTGYSEYQTKTASFEIVPDAERESQMYVAFRMSDTAGPVPSDNLSGKPVVMEIVLPEVADTTPEEPADPKKAARAKRSPRAKKAAKMIEQMQKVNYMIPAVCTVKVKEGSELLMQSRVPVYQLGVLTTVPANATLQ